MSTKKTKNKRRRGVCVCVGWGGSWRNQFYKRSHPENDIDPYKTISKALPNLDV